MAAALWSRLPVDRSFVCLTLRTPSSRIFHIFYFRILNGNFPNGPRRRLRSRDTVVVCWRRSPASSLLSVDVAHCSLYPNSLLTETWLLFRFSVRFFSTFHFINNSMTGAAPQSSNNGPIEFIRGLANTSKGSNWLLSAAMAFTIWAVEWEGAGQDVPNMNSACFFFGDSAQFWKS